MRILIVEDDVDLRRHLENGLKRESYSVDSAEDAKEAVRMAAENTYDIILMDIMMPGLDGLWLLRTLRQARNNTLIFMITGQAEEQFKIDAYQGGADDYLVKPFKLTELIAKIRAWLKRRHDFLSTDVKSTLLSVGDLRLDLLKRRAVRRDQITPLTPKEFAILEYLMRNQGKIKSQTAILENVSNVDFDGMSNTIEFHIKNLREKIDKDFEVKLIKTVRGSGYMIDDNP